MKAWFYQKELVAKHIIFLFQPEMFFRGCFQLRGKNEPKKEP